MPRVSPLDLNRTGIYVYELNWNLLANGDASNPVARPWFPRWAPVAGNSMYFIGYRDSFRAADGNGFFGLNCAGLCLATTAIYQRVPIGLPPPRTMTS